MFCSRCGIELADGSKFCHSCGGAVAPTAPSTLRTGSKTDTSRSLSAGASGEPSTASQAGSVTIVATGTPVYYQADSASSLITRLAAGMTLEVVGEAWGFYYVRVSKADGNGFVKKDDVIIAQSYRRQTAALPPRVDQAMVKSPPTTSSGNALGTWHSVTGGLVIATAAIAIMGCLLPWTGFQRASANAFEQGYVTGDGYWASRIVWDSPTSAGNDGVLILAIAAAAGVLGLLCFTRKNAVTVPASLGVLLLGAAITGIAGFNAGRIVHDVREICNDCGIARGLGDGIPVTIASGVAMVGTAIMGLVVAFISSVVGSEPVAGVLANAVDSSAVSRTRTLSDDTSHSTVSGSASPSPSLPFGRHHETVSVKASGTLVYHQADEGSKPIARLAAGMTLEVLGEAWGFYFVRVSKVDGDGFVKKDDVIA